MQDLRMRLEAADLQRNVAEAEGHAAVAATGDLCQRRAAAAAALECEELQRKVAAAMLQREEVERAAAAVGLERAQLEAQRRR